MNKKVVLVTGASSGIGKATALTLLKKGMTVYGAARRIDKMLEIEAAGGKAIKMDITNSDDRQNVVSQIIAEQGKIDVLVNNAGYAVYGAVEDVSYEDVKKQFEVNLFGLAELTKAVLPFMRKQKSGKIINISSMGGKMHTPLGAWYHATKHALEGWSDCLRLELKQFNIDVVVIEPGAIQTEFSDVMYQPLIDRTKGSPYENFVTNFVNKTEKYMKKGNMGSQPSVIADVIYKAIESENPKTRYVAGKMAKPMMFIRKWFGDKVFDRILISQFG